ncbi:hypothetical protein AmDm5_2867 [Acetobacter malorum]|nr:hypothetical protein AmDm5_2867 [Acetobacter malorum]
MILITSVQKIILLVIKAFDVFVFIFYLEQSETRSQKEPG